jgi:hypothetical protein
MTDKKKAGKPRKAEKGAHTELRPHDTEKARAADAKRKAQANGDMLPKTMSDDALDDLFNDMPV